MAEINKTLSTSEALINQLLENEVTSQNYSELSEAMKLLEIHETSLRNKRQLMSLKLRKYYMNQYLELRRKTSPSMTVRE
jgi:hypothetical protein